MKLLVPFVDAIYGFVGNFGIAIVVSIILLSLILIPFRYLSAVNEKKKEAVKPKIKEIQKKYNANALGVSEDDDEALDPELRKYSKDERDELMGNEISAVYKAAGYHAFTGWIPAALVILMIIFLYGGISGACPDGFYKLTYKAASEIGNNTAIAVLAAPLIINLLTNIVTTAKSAIKYKRSGTGKKSELIISIVGAVLGLALIAWVMFSTSVAIAIAISCLSIINTGRSIVKTYRKNTKEIYANNVAGLEQ